MGDPLTESRLLSGNATTGAAKARIKWIGNQWILDFDTFVFQYEVAGLIFRSGTLPPGVTLQKTRPNAGDLTLRWTLDWHGSAFKHVDALSDFGQRLFERGAQASDEFAEDRFARENQEEIDRVYRREENSKFLPALNMTAAQAFQKLQPGAYLAAPGKGITPIPAASDDGPVDTRWFVGTDGGYFVWLGSREGRRYLELFPVSDNPRFWRDITWYLQRGWELDAAVDEFDRQTEYNMRRILGAFAIALASAPGSYPRADRLDTGMIGALRGSRRMTGDDPMPDPPFPGVLARVNPAEAVPVAMAMASFIVEKIHEWEDNGEQDPELRAAGDAIGNELERLFRQAQQPSTAQWLRTGELGEAKIMEILRARGYEVIALQNNSGHGIDLIAFKKGIGSTGLLIYVEVKTSENTGAPSLSKAQEDTRRFVRSRLERTANAEGHFKNVPQALRDVAKALLREIDNGRPIGGIRVKVSEVRNSVKIRIKFRIWKPPTARVVPRRRR
jgi:Holliday junction resolvase-like predicted endonuclease